ncbi:uncharacterized protein LOC134831702 isoform X2 [Culicoides brevitarsis]|uniref:uncharacterized protein LOC134831702 isoform X2 n=1 Tax=Culicoides brevitarsis TaxID=469753 RepID=UPI00307B2035
MLGALKRRWKTQRRPQLEDHDSDEDGRQDGMIPPRFIDVQQGKIYLGPPKQLDTVKDKSQSTSPVVEKELKDQIETMNRAMRTKERRSMQVCRDHKTLQARFQRQENSLATLQYENKSLHQRVRQYELCLDDVMRKVVDAIVAEDNLRDEVSMLKTRVRDLEAQNAALSASPMKGRDEGYCTMSSGQPPPSQEAHLENLPEEPEQWLLSAAPCSAEMEDWSMSQEEMGTAVEEEWTWNGSTSLLADAITQTEEDFNDLLAEQISYSDDEEIICKNFTRDFYKLVNIHKSESLQSQLNSEEKIPYVTSDDESTTSSSGHCHHDVEPENEEDLSDDDDSPTPSEAGRAQVFSCSSTTSSSDDSGDSFSVQMKNLSNAEHKNRTDDNIEEIEVIDASKFNVVLQETTTTTSNGDSSEEDVVVVVRRSNSTTSSNNKMNGSPHGSPMMNRRNAKNSRKIVKEAKVQPCMSWRRSNGWTRVSGQSKDKPQHPDSSPTKIPTKCFDKNSRPIATVRSLPRATPPVPLKRTLGAS